MIYINRLLKTLVLLYIVTILTLQFGCVHVGKQQSLVMKSMKRQKIAEKNVIHGIISIYDEIELYSFIFNFSLIENAGKIEEMKVCMPFNIQCIDLKKDEDIQQYIHTDATLDDICRILLRRIDKDSSRYILTMDNTDTYIDKKTGIKIYYSKIDSKRDKILIVDKDAKVSIKVAYSVSHSCYTYDAGSTK